MSDIFVSYAHEDAVRAKGLADTFASLGWSVWWDDRTRAGTEFDQVVDEQLDAVLCVVVVWSSASVNSRWVRAEAAAADEQGKLLPVTFERDLRLPVLFRQINTALLTSTALADIASTALGLLDDIAMTIDRWLTADSAECHFEGRRAVLERMLPGSSRD